jgi:sRNA-binding protein
LEETVTVQILDSLPRALGRGPRGKWADIVSAIIAANGRWAVAADFTMADKQSATSLASAVRAGAGAWAGQAWEAQVTVHPDPERPDDFAVCVRWLGVLDPEVAEQRAAKVAARKEAAARKAELAARKEAVALRKAEAAAAAADNGEDPAADNSEDPAADNSEDPAADNGEVPVKRGRKAKSVPVVDPFDVGVSA